MDFKWQVFFKFSRMFCLSQQSSRCLTLDGTRLRTETAATATKTATETEGEDTGTEDRRLTPPAVTETETGTETGTGTEEDGDTDRKEALCTRGGMFLWIARHIWSNWYTILWHTTVIILFHKYQLHICFGLGVLRLVVSLTMSASVQSCSRSYDKRSTEQRPFDRRYCEGYRRLDQNRDPDREREREPHGATESYYPRDFSPNLFDYRRGRERVRERDESYRRKGSRRKHKRRRRRTRSYSPSSSVSTASPELVL